MIAADHRFHELPEEERVEFSAKRVAELEELVPPGALINGKSWVELSLAEKKSVLIDRELEMIGMGKYQWSIFVLCGCGYFLDLCWAQAGGLVAAPLIQELGVSHEYTGHLSAAFNAGLTLGAFSWGILVDIVGRRWCFNLTCLIASVFGFLFAAPSNYPAVCFFYALLGFGVGGNIPIDATITLEFLPKNKQWLLATLSAFQPIGVVAATLIAYALIPTYSCDPTYPSCDTNELPCCTKESNMGWRYTMYALAGITFLVFFFRFVVFKFQESPKFLLSRGHDTHALDVIHTIAKYNQLPQPRLDLDDFAALEYEDDVKDLAQSQSESPVRLSRVRSRQHQGSTMILARDAVLETLHLTFGHLKGLVNTQRNAYIFAVLAVAYMSDFWSFSIAGYFLPLILRAKGVDTERSLEDTYRSYIWIYLPGVTATLVASFFMQIPRLSRKWRMVISAFFMGVSLAMYQLVNSVEASVGFNAMEYWFQSVFNALLYAYTPDVFPATVRGSACGMLSTLGRIAGIIAPIGAGQVCNGSSSPGVLWLGAAGAWVSMLAVACLPAERRGKQTL